MPGTQRRRTSRLSSDATAQSRKFVCRSVGGVLFITGLTLPGYAEAQSFTITRTSSPVFYRDAPELQGMYASYRITNTSGVSSPDTWANIGTFSGGVISLAPFEDGLVRLGALEPGETKTAFFYLVASASDGPPQGHVVEVHGSRPPGVPLSSASFGMSLSSTVQANSNKVLTTVIGPTSPVLGGLVSMTVTGKTGTIGSDEILSFTPAVFADWRADAYDLVRTEITLSEPNSGTFTDELLIPPGALGSSQNTLYTAVYTFRAVGTTEMPTAVSPVAYISSGSQAKHTTTKNFGSLPPIQPADNRLLLGKSATPTMLSGAGVVRFRLELSNGSADAVTVDEISDVLPASPDSAAYRASTSSYDGSSIADPAIDANTLTWTGPFIVPAGGTAALEFDVDIPGTSGIYLNSAVARIGVERIDASLDTSDDMPATASVTVEQPALTVTPDGADLLDLLPSNGTSYSYGFEITNDSDVPMAFDLYGFPGTASPFVTVDSIVGPQVTRGARADSARLASLMAGASDSAFVWFRVGNVAAGSRDTLLLRARAAADTSVADSGWVVIDVIRPAVSISKSVDPSGVVQLGTDLTYVIDVVNVGTADAVTVTTVDSLPAELHLKVGSVSSSFPAGVTVVVEYSSDDGASWMYTPVSEGCGATLGYDDCVTHIRWTLLSVLGSGAPQNAGRIEFIASVR